MQNGYFRNMFRFFCIALFIFTTSVLTGCAGFLPAAGPNTRSVEKAADDPKVTGIQIVDVTDAVARKLIASQKRSLFSETLGGAVPSDYVIGVGDVVAVSVWEAPPATLFSAGMIDVSGVPATSRGTDFPNLMVNSEGVITVPFAGQVPAAGRSLQQIEAEIVRRLQGMAHQPQVLVRLTHNATANVTVVGEVAANTRMPLTPSGERLLDALAAAGGVKQTVSKVTLQVTRGANVYALPLDMIIRDPQQNIVLKPGDVITALYQPLSFTILGASGKNEEVNFEAQGISLTQALARAGGLQDARADARGVFIFRLEPVDSLDWPVRPTLTTPDGKVPVIYRADLADPATFFAAQAFPVKDKDMVYVSSAPAVGFQKFLNLVLSVTYPTLTLMNSLQQ
jgi:polysaccharide export outer membrane protein